MKVPFVDLKIQYQSIKTEIDSAIQRVIENTAFIGGSEVTNFEESYAKLYKVKHCISTANGTDSLYIVLKMLGIGSGDEVITTPNSWISTSETISQTGAKPVFVDIEEDYFTINPEKISDKINSRTKCIVPVHIFGQSCNMESLMHIGKNYNLPILEDCAQAHFSEFNGKRVGTFGLAASFSFYPGKNLGAYGDAGCIITNHEEYAKKFKMFARHGALIKHQHEIEGINSRLDGLQAAILSVKLCHIHKWTEQRIKNAKLYDSLLCNIDGLRIPKVRPNTKHTYHLYVILAEKRDELQDFLKQIGIETAIHYPKILPNLNAYKYLKHQKEDFPVANTYQEKILSLPMFPELTEEQINYTCHAIKEFYKK